MIEINTNTEFTTHNPILLYGKLYFSSDTKELKVGDGVTRWASAAAVNVTTLIAGKSVDTASPTLNDFIRYCSSHDKWEHDAIFCFTNVSTFAASGSTVIPAFQLWIETSNSTGIPTGRFKKGDGTTTITNLPWMGGYTSGTGISISTDLVISVTSHTHSESDVTNLVTDLGNKAPLASPTFTGTPAAPTATAGTNTTQIATTAFVQAAFGNVDALVYKGVVDCSASPNYPAADCGHVYKISVAGKIGGASGIIVEVGDMVICTHDSSASGDQATVGSYWNVVQRNTELPLASSGVIATEEFIYTTPTTPVSGGYYAIGTGTLTGICSGHPNEIALYINSSWTYIVPTLGQIIYDKQWKIYRKYNGTEWYTESYELTPIFSSMYQDDYGGVVDAVLGFATSPPVSNNNGDRYIVDYPATDAFEGYEDAIATYVEWGDYWYFAYPYRSTIVYCIDDRLFYGIDANYTWSLDNILNNGMGILSQIESITATPTANGKVYLVASSGTSVPFTGNENKLARYVASKWVFITPVAGMTVYDKSTSSEYRYNGSSWTTTITSSGISSDSDKLDGYHATDFAMSTGTPSDTFTIDSDYATVANQVILKRTAAKTVQIRNGTSTEQGYLEAAKVVLNDYEATHPWGELWIGNDSYMDIGSTDGSGTYIDAGHKISTSHYATLLLSLVNSRSLLELKFQGTSLTSYITSIIDNTSARLGIGTNNPVCPLNVSLIGGGEVARFALGSATSDTVSVMIGKTNLTTEGFKLSYDGQNAHGTLETVYASGKIFLKTNGANRMAIAADGKIGIGIDTPLYPLHLETSAVDTAICLNSTVTGKVRKWLVGIGVGTPNGAFAIRDETSTTNRLTINDSGLIGIGTIIPKINLQMGTTGGIQNFDATQLALRYNMYNDGSNNRYIQAANKACSLQLDNGTGLQFWATNTASTVSDSIISDLKRPFYVNLVGDGYFAGDLNLASGKKFKINNVNLAAADVGAAPNDATLITGATAETTPDDADSILIYDSSAGALRKMTRANFQKGTKTIILTAAGALSSLTSGATLAQVETSTNKQNYYTAEFPYDSTKYVEWNFQMPDSWDEGVVKAQVIWTPKESGSNTGVAWFIQGMRVADNIAIDGAWGTAIEIDDDVQTIGNILSTSISDDITISGASGSKYVFLRAYRKHDDSYDTFDKSVYMIGIKLEYTTTGGSD